MSGRLRQLSNRLEARYKILVMGVAGAVFVAAVTGVGLAANDGPSMQSSTPQAAPTTTTSPPAPPRRGIPGFGPVAFQLKDRGGQLKDHCGLLAETTEQLNSGLMRQQDLAGYDAMVFRMPQVSDAAFYMANVPIPLDIAWFDDSGLFVSSTEMPVCRAEAKDCPRFRAKARYRFALEAPAGSAAQLGAVDGSTLLAGGSGCA